MWKSMVLGLAVVAVAAFAAPAALVGKVTQVVDGGSFVLETADGLSVKVRLAGVEALELCQPWGPEARDALKDWVQGQPVSVTSNGKQRTGLIVGQVTADGSDINRRMVEEGHAFSERTKWDHGPYVKEERVAHALARGMYSVGGSENPAEFRRKHGPCQ